MLCQSFDNYHHCHLCHAIVMGGVQLLVGGLGGGCCFSLVTMGCTVAPSVTVMSHKIWSVGIHGQCGDWAAVTPIFLNKYTNFFRTLNSLFSAGGQQYLYISISAFYKTSLKALVGMYSDPPLLC